MAINRYVGLGRVVSVTPREVGTDNFVLSVIVSVQTGKKIPNKAEGEYDPSQLFNVPIWGNYGRSFSDNNRIAPGSMLAFEGQLDIPNVYEKEGKTYVTQQVLKGENIQVIGTPEPSAKAAKSGAKSSSKPSAEAAVVDDSDASYFD